MWIFCNWRVYIGQWSWSIETDDQNSICNSSPCNSIRPATAVGVMLLLSGAGNKPSQSLKFHNHGEGPYLSPSPGWKQIMGVVGYPWLWKLREGSFPALLLSDNTQPAVASVHHWPDIKLELKLIFTWLRPVSGQFGLSTRFDVQISKITAPLSHFCNIFKLSIAMFCWDIDLSIVT